MSFDSKTLVANTCRELESQEVVPLSPGRMDQGTTTLCAGAALVKQATAMARSQRAAVEFAKTVVTQDSHYIWDQGAELGLDATLLERVVIHNNALKPEARLAGVTAFLSDIGPNLCMVRR